MFASVMQAIPGPSDCFLTGTCGLGFRPIGPHSGTMYLALGLIALGVAGLWREWRSKPPPAEAAPS